VVIVVCQTPYLPGMEINLEDIAERLLEEEDPLAIMRPVCPFAKHSKPADVGREIVGWRFLRPCRLLTEGADKDAGERNENRSSRASHRATASVFRHAFPGREAAQLMINLSVLLCKRLAERR
jgi:hypothetical protein